MKHVVLSPLGRCLSIVPIALVMFGCASSINHNKYAVNNEKTDPIIEVVRDTKTAAKSLSNDGCKTNFYINNTNVGSFGINDISTYQLTPGHYNFSVENCQGECSKYGSDIEIKKDEFHKFTLSADSTGKPFIIVNKSK